MLPELVILLNLTANSTDVKLADELYAFREPRAEYFYYAASDEKSQIGKEGKTLIDHNNLSLNFEVTVTYMDDSLSIARSDINAISTSTGDNWQMVESLITSKTADEILALYQRDKGFRLPIESGENHASYLELFSWPGDSVAGFFFNFQAIKGDQLTVVRGYSKDPELTVGDVHAHWQTLVDTYRDLPAQQFEGASYY